MNQKSHIMNASALQKSGSYSYVLYALMAALICIFAPLSVPIGPIPISLTNLVLYFAIFIIGTKGTVISYVVYLLIGAIGFPVFSGFTGGLVKIAGPTGGYLLGFIPMVVIMGFFYKISKELSYGKSFVITFAGMVLGTIAAYLFGTVWFVFQMECGWGYALSVCVIPFIPFDIGKMIIAGFLGRKVRQPLVIQGFIE